MTQFEGFSNETVDCAVCDAMLPEAVDGMLNAVEQQAFDRHMAGCTRCSQEFAEAKRGAAWLSMLKTKAPEPPAGMLERILAETSGLMAPVSQAAPVVHAAPALEAAPAWIPQTIPTPSRGGWNTRWAATRMKLSEMFSIDNAQMMFQPRLAMTAAMAFFSLALTLNMSGVHLRDLRAENFSPSGVRRAVADTSASASRSFQNMRVVYQMESRVSELRSDERR
jgi:anti-sigma factor RsiW